jgi:hypothetical protein
MRTQSGSSEAKGTLANDGTSGKETTKTTRGQVTSTLYEVKPFAFSPEPSIIIADGNLTSGFKVTSGHVSALVSASWSEGNSGVGHRVTPSTLGWIKQDGSLDFAGASGNWNVKSDSSVEHGRSLAGSQIGSATSTYSASGTRTNRQTGSSSASSSSSATGNTSSNMTSSSLESTVRTAASASHSESAYHSNMTASSLSHRESTSGDVMTSTGETDRNYYSQIFESLKQMWDETQDVIRKLEAQTLLASRYLVDQLSVATPQARLVGNIALPTAPSLIQRPGVAGTRIEKPFNRFIVR